MTSIKVCEFVVYFLIQIVPILTKHHTGYCYFKAC